jgi:hypothetical protein
MLWIELKLASASGAKFFQAIPDLQRLLTDNKVKFVSPEMRTFPRSGKRLRALYVIPGTHQASLPFV